MDPRRNPRVIIDPKIRHVGFFTQAPPPDRTQSSPPPSLSPRHVIIPPLRQASDNLSCVAPSRPVGVPVPTRRPPADGCSAVVGSYNPADDSVLGTSPSGVSPSIDDGYEEFGEFSEDSVNWVRRGGSGNLVDSTGPSVRLDLEERVEEIFDKGNFADSSVPSIGLNLVKTDQKFSYKEFGEFSEDSVNMVPRGDFGNFAAPYIPSVRLDLVKKGQETSIKDFGKERVTKISNDLPSNSKSQREKTTKAERRALQESQRAAKAPAKGEVQKPAAASGRVSFGRKSSNNVKQTMQKKDGPHVAAAVAPLEKKGGERPPQKDRKKDVPPPRMQFDDKSRVEKAKRHLLVKQSEAKNRVELFRHLPQYEHENQLPDLEAKFFQHDPMHPAVYKVGLQYLAGDVFGGNARCIAMLKAFYEAIRDYSTPPEKAFSRDLTTKINSYISFLIECRPLSISMGNAIRFLKARIAKLPLSVSESEAKSSLCSDIDRFINEKIVLADKVIVRHAVTKIKNGDVLLAYGSSSVVEMIFSHAHELGKQFCVVVVDSRPKLEGQALLRRLVGKGISCTYTHINALSYIMHKVTTVFLGAASVFSNGTVYSRVGTACVAMVANAFKVPVLICCEAYKFHERVQLDSICSNELGDSLVIAKVQGRMDVNYLKDWTRKENLQLLNLLYDATPSDYVSMIITDYGMIPPTSVPVIVREYGKEHLFV